MISRSPFRPVLCLIMIITGCATDRARQVREERPLTVGLLGAAWHPTGDTAVGLTLGANSGVPWSEDGDDIDVKGSSGMAVFGRWFPMDDSAFYLGAGLMSQSIDYEFDGELAADSSRTTRVKLTTASSWIGMPVGWAWIWENGFSLTVDFGPAIRMSLDENLTTSGDPDVNQGERDDTITRIREQDHHIYKFGMGTGIIGYSF